MGARDDFERDGIAFLPQALDSMWIDLLKVGIKRVMNQPGPYRRVASPGSPTEFVNEEWSYFTTPEYKLFLHQSPLVDLVAEVLGCDQLWYFLDQTFVKHGGSGPTTWHQDTSYFCADGSTFASAWISVDPVPQEASLRMVRGSFRWPLRAEEHSSLPDRWPNVDEADGFDVVSFPIEPGDVVLLHPSTLHGGGPGTGSRRRTVSFRLFGDDVVFQEPPAGDMVPLLPGIRATLQPGDPVRGPWFPQVLPRASTLTL